MVIEYKKGYKYQLHARTIIHTGVFPEKTITAEFATLYKNGNLHIYPGYAWDGASGFPDLKCVMRASLYHDCLYQLMRENGLDHKWKKAADDLLILTATEDGANRLVVKLIHLAVVLFGDPFTKRERAKKVNKAGK